MGNKSSKLLNNNYRIQFNYNDVLTYNHACQIKESTTNKFIYFTILNSIRDYINKSLDITIINKDTNMSYNFNCDINLSKFNLINIEKKIYNECFFVDKEQKNKMICRYYSIDNPEFFFVFHESK